MALRPCQLPLAAILGFDVVPGATTPIYPAFTRSRFRPFTVMGRPARTTARSTPVITAWRSRVIGVVNVAVPLEVVTVALSASLAHLMSAVKGTVNRSEVAVTAVAGAVTAGFVIVVPGNERSRRTEVTPPRLFPERVTTSPGDTVVGLAERSTGTGRGG